MKYLNMNKKNILILFLITFLFVFVFHVLVLFRVIPFSIVWGGKIKTIENMQKMEAISLSVNALILVFVLSELGVIRKKCPSNLAKFIYLVLLNLFIFNTIGNLFSESNLEKIIFTPITLALSVMSFILLFRKESQNKSS